MKSSATAQGWQQILRDKLAIFGHRNWIVVADAAYPEQSRSGIETVLSDADHVQAVRAVCNAIANCGHVRPRIYLDAELEFVPDADAPGVTQLKEQLFESLGNQAAKSVPHEEIIAKLDQAAQMFNILIIKTTATIPYTSIFFELDCAYWDDDAERRLRDGMRALGSADGAR